MGLFDNAGKRDLTGGGEYFNPGRYVVRIESAQIKKSSRPGNPDFMCVEGTIVEVLSTSDVEGHKPSNKEGSRATQICKVNNDYFQPTVDNFVAAILDKAASDVTPEDCEKAFDGLSTVGEEIEMEAVGTFTKRGTPFTKLFWRSIDL